MSFNLPHTTTPSSALQAGRGHEHGADVQRRLAAIVESSHDAIVGSFPDGTISTWNPAAERLFGLSAEDAVGRPISIIAPPDRIDEQRQMLDRLLRGERVDDLEATRRHIDGHEIDVAISAFAVSGASGEIEGAAVIVRDISTRKHAESVERADLERRIARTEMQVAESRETALIGTWEWVIRTNVVEWSDETFQIFGRSRDDYTPTFESWLHAIAPEDREHSIAAVEQTLATGTPFSFPHKVVLPDGSLRSVRCNGQAIMGPDGVPERLVGTARDLTAAIRAAEEKERLAARLQQSERLESVGQLAGGIAHDFNNLLAVILNYAEFVKDDLGPDHPAREDLEAIRRAGERAAALTRQLLMFSRRERVQPEVLDVNAVVADVKRLLGRAIGERVDLVTALDPKAGRIEADQGQLEQVLVNLAVNARDAMPDGGTVTIATSNVELEQPGGTEPGPYVRITVTDTGTGIEPDVAEHIFEPFFTSKPKGQGTGLGLATVYGIVTQSGGHIELDTDVGVGTTFSVYLPATEREGPAALETDAAAAPPPSARTILIVEDEPAVRELTSRILTGHGYTVLEASDGEEGIEAWRRHGKIDLVLTDVVMPGLSGPEMADRMREVQPGLGVLYMSGYTDDFVSGAERVVGGAPILEKPFSTDTLLLSVHAALEEPTGS